MKALSILQPYAELIVSGKKDIEIRKWKTSFRGNFLIHASKRVLEEEIQKFGYKKSELSFGAILGEAKLLNVKVYLTNEEFLSDAKRHLAEDWLGSKWERVYGFVLGNPLRFGKVIPAQGALYFWDFKGTLGTKEADASSSSHDRKDRPNQPLETCK
jgi:hypothetical protein